MVPDSFKHLFAKWGCEPVFSNSNYRIAVDWLSYYSPQNDCLSRFNVLMQNKTKTVISISIVLQETVFKMSFSFLNQLEQENGLIMS